MKKISLLFFISLLPSFARIANAQSNPAAYTVQAWATVQDNPPVITLHWKHDPHAQQYEIFSRNFGDNQWNDLGPVNGSDSLYADNTVATGTTYEYEILDSAKSDSVYAAFGFVASGIGVQRPVMPGKVILLVDKTYSTPLASEIARWTADLEAEGWGVIRHNVNRTDAVPTVKALIKQDYLSDSVHVRSLFILGHVPVPYSGDIAPDGHTPGNGNHQGAWPADIYYGNFYTTWTDNKVKDSTGQDPRNWNGIGDGKFDQDTIRASIAPEELEVGRVDLYDMPSFLLSDTALIKQYLNRDHAFRTGELRVPKRALVDDNFGIIQGEYDVPASNGWRNFGPLVSPDSVFNFHLLSASDNWFGYLDTAKYLWAYGCGGGSWASCSGVGVTAQYAGAGSEAVFTMLFGSFFGDWGHSDGLLRAPLATQFGLTSCWAGRPYWYFHPLGMGETFGYCTKLSQNASGQGFYSDASYRHVNWVSNYVWSLSMTGVHVALMGDPTLRMQYLSGPPTALSASVAANSVTLTWSAPSIAVPGYNIYRANAVGDTLMKINTSLVTAATFTDMSPLNDSNIYVVRAAALTTTPSGSWWNESGGVLQGVKVTLAGVAQAAASGNELTVRQNGEFLDIRLSEAASSAVRLSIFDVAGREIAVIADGALSPGVYNYRVCTAALASGAYFVRMASPEGVKSAKIFISR